MGVSKGSALGSSLPLHCQFLGMRVMSQNWGLWLYVSLPALEPTLT